MWKRALNGLVVSSHCQFFSDSNKAAEILDEAFLSILQEDEENNPTKLSITEEEEIGNDIFAAPFAKGDHFSFLK